jgi:hypothetical protein
LGESQFRRGAYTVVLFICTYFVVWSLEKYRRRLAWTCWAGAAWYSSGSGHSTTIETCRTVKKLPGYSVQNSPSGSFLSGGGLLEGGNSIWYCVNGMPQKETPIILRTPVCFRILSSSLTSVSIFSVCCYSIISISVVSPPSPSPFYVTGPWSDIERRRSRKYLEFIHLSFMCQTSRW